MPLLEALKSIDVEEVEDQGICGKVSDYLYDFEGMSFHEAKAHIERHLHPIFQIWPEFSGDIEFPVPSPDEGIGPSTCYSDADEYDMWDKDHPYGAARRRLLEFCINQLEKDNA